MAGYFKVLFLIFFAVTVFNAVNSQKNGNQEANKYEKYYKTYKLMTSPNKLPAVPPTRRLYRPHLYQYRRHYHRPSYLSRPSSLRSRPSSLRTRPSSARPRPTSHSARPRTAPQKSPPKGTSPGAGKKFIIDDDNELAKKSFSGNRRGKYGASAYSKGVARTKSSVSKDQTKIMRYSKPKNRKIFQSKPSATDKGRNYLKNLLTKYELPEPENSTSTPTYKYVCPPEFLKLGNGCYYVSKALGSWQWAHFECRERGSQLAALGSEWEDGVLRGYLNRPTITPLNRWIGGIHDWQRGRWQWGSTGAAMRYQGFLSLAHETAVSPQWSCAYMNPQLYYRWSYAKCTEKMHFICEAPFKKVKN